MYGRLDVFGYREMQIRSACGRFVATTWGPAMPGIHQRLLKSVVYLYPSIDDANRGRRAGGTGFLVCFPTKSNPSKGGLYVVTNQHVIDEEKADSRVIRINNKNGGISVFEIPKESWVSHPDGDDLAACPITLKRDRFEYHAISINLCVTEKDVSTGKVMLGDDVFMMGRYVDKEGRQTNEPSIRFGNLSMMPGEPIMRNGREVQVFFVDMRSHGGYSGSPVVLFINDTSTIRLEGYDAAPPRQPFAVLLGIDSGHYPLTCRVYESGNSEPMSDVGVEVPAGMATVVPGWRIDQLLTKPEQFQAHQQAVEAIAKAKLAEGNRLTAKNDSSHNGCHLK